MRNHLSGPFSAAIDNHIRKPMTRPLTSLLILSIFYSGCAFSRMTNINSEPSGARLRVAGEMRGDTPIQTKIGCSTFKEKEIALSKEGYRTLSMDLDYNWRGRNVAWSIILFWPGLLIVGKCPKENYVFELEQETASLRGQSTLTIVELNSTFDLYVDNEQIVPGQRVAFPSGWHEVNAQIDGTLHSVGEIHMEADTDYVLSLDAH